MLQASRSEVVNTFGLVRESRRVSGRAGFNSRTVLREPKRVAKGPWTHVQRLTKRYNAIKSTNRSSSHLKA